MEKVTLKIAQATHTDAAAIEMVLEEIRAWLRERGLTQWSEPFTPDWIEARINDGVLYIVRNDKDVVGVFRLLSSDPEFWGTDDAPSLYLHTFVVRRKYSGMGYGNEIMEWVKEITALQGKQYLRLDTAANNPVLCNYYLSAGFKDCGEIIIRGWQAKLFQLAITPKIS
jgi:GNAT superfamily N-acetyltransferase